MNTPKIIKTGLVRFIGKYEGSAEQLVRVKFPAGWSREQMAEWANDTFTTHCHHAHDCCGHWYSHSSFYRARRAKGREWLVPVVHTQNV